MTMNEQVNGRQDSYEIHTTRPPVIIIQFHPVDCHFKQLYKNLVP
jgi:hypothetical protein